jgi:hypothetical protein
MGVRLWDRSTVRVLLVVLGFAGIILCLFLLAVASWVDGSTSFTVVMIATALTLLIGGVLLIRSAVS